jgi:hypothetical protein
MKKLGGKDIVRIMKEEYVSHLRGVLNEVEVFDSRGKMIIGKDLKVIHKTSGYEYTVDSVKGKDGLAKITLRTPETPRPSTQDITTIVPKDKKKEIEKNRETEKSFEFPDIEIESDDPEDGEEKEDKVDRGVKAHPKPVKPPTEEQVFVVDQAEFEKEYEEA